MTEVIKASLQIGDNHNISGVLDSKSDSKKFSCWSSEFFHVESHSNVYGKTNDNKFVSLLNCLGNESSHMSNNERSYSCEIYSHTLIMGKEKVNPETDKFDSISLTIGNPLKLFRNLDSFGYVPFPDEKLITALNKQEYTPHFDSDKHPVVAYFNGNFNIFEQDTLIGKIKAHNLISHGSWGGVTGVRIENKVIITIDFNEGVSIEESFKRANLVSLFFRFISGKGLFFKDISLKKVEHEHSEFDVFHDSYNWGTNIKDDYYSDPLLDVTDDSFAKILSNWFSKSDRENVRYNFYNTYFRDVYSTDRLINAANMFDIFPIADEDKKITLDPRATELLSNLKKHIKTEFSEFPDIKQSLSQSIGFLTRKSLKDRVQERLDILKPHYQSNKISIVDLEFIVNIAIKSRNYFVHGSEYKKLSPEKLHEFKGLFIDTFEYIYALSELTECGWLIADSPIWGSHHKIRGCEQQIEFSLIELKKVLGDK